MQLEINALPVLIGAGSYFFFWAITKLTASRSPREASRRRPPPPADVGKDARGKFALGESILCSDVPFGAWTQGRLDSPEPVPEPAPELSPASAAPAAKPGRRRGVVLALAAAALLALFLLVPPAGRSEPGDLPSQPPTWEHEEAVPQEAGLQLQEAEELPLPQVSTSVPVAAEPPAEPPVELPAEPPAMLAAEPPAEGAAELAAEGAAASGDAASEASTQVGLVAQDDIVSPTTPFTVKLHRQTMDGQQRDYIRSAYYGTLMVGSPPQPFTVVFDTGSGHLVLPSTYCSSGTCKAHKRYSRRGSSTGLDVNYDGAAVAAGEARDQIAVSFGTGEVTGVFVEDVICVGQAEGGSNGNTSQALAANGEQDSSHCVKLRMIAATALSDDPFAAFQFDGIMGMGLEGLSQAPEFNLMSVLLQQMQQTGKGLTSTFGVFLAENREEDSEIALGGWAQGHLAEDLSWDAVHDPDQGHWIVQVRSVRVDDMPLRLCEDGSCKAAVDTGTSLLAVPSAAFSELYQGLRHIAPKGGHCQGFGPLIHIELEHFTVTLGPRDYARPALAKGRAPTKLYTQGSSAQRRADLTRQDLRCIPMLMTLDLPEPLGPNLIILGEPVLRKYYTVFDAQQKRIGFGRARHRQAPLREDLLMMAPELDPKSGRVGGGRRSPTMFDIFRWRGALR